MGHIPTDANSALCRTEYGRGPPGHLAPPYGWHLGGYATPAAIGGAIGRPGLPTLAIIGDYGFNTRCQELGHGRTGPAIAHHPLGTTANLGEDIEDSMTRAQIRTEMAVIAHNPDFCKLAEALRRKCSRPKIFGHTYPRGSGQSVQGRSSDVDLSDAANRGLDLFLTFMQRLQLCPGVPKHNDRGAGVFLYSQQLTRTGSFTLAFSRSRAAWNACCNVVPRLTPAHCARFRNDIWLSTQSGHLRSSSRAPFARAQHPRQRARPLSRIGPPASPLRGRKREGGRCFPRPVAHATSARVAIGHVAEPKARPRIGKPQTAISDCNSGGTVFERGHIQRLTEQTRGFSKGLMRWPYHTTNTSSYVSSSQRQAAQLLPSLEVVGNSYHGHVDGKSRARDLWATGFADP